jgi:uncharacterized protein YjiS (DUF1127 family)
MTDVACTNRSACTAAPMSTSFLAALKVAVAVVQDWRRRYRSRYELASYSQNERRDLGFAADLDAEIAKPFWRK